jgi:hypothetical protein
MQVNRFDEINLNDLKLKETSEGYLEGFAVATRTGVFKYMKSDGSIQNEFRPEDEVFKEDSVNSFKLQPITNDHPNNQVNADNVKDLNVGTTGQEVKRIDNYLAPYIKIMDKEAVQAVKSGKVGLSFGYSVTLEKSDGIHKGERYDYIQRDIKGNHLAIVYQGRAGDKARMRLDDNDAICVFTNFNNNPKNNMKTIKIDGKDFEVQAEVASRLDSLEATNSKLKEAEKESKTKMDSLEGKKDSLESQIKSLNEKVEELSKRADSEDINEKVKERIALEKSAKEIIKSDKDDVDLSNLSNQEIKIKAIKAFSPEFKEDGKSEEYINARFDSLIEIKKDFNLALNMKGAKNDASDSSSQSINLSNKDLERELINRSIKKNK